VIGFVVVPVAEDLEVVGVFESEDEAREYAERTPDENGLPLYAVEGFHVRLIEEPLSA
jgi:hypothetical protein